MLLKKIKQLITGKVQMEDKSAKGKVKKWVKRMLKAQLVALLPYIIVALGILIICMIVSVASMQVISGTIGDLDSVWIGKDGEGSSSKNCSCGDCENAVLIASTASSSLNIDYEWSLSEPDNSEALYTGQIIQLCETMQNKLKYPAVLLIIAKQHMESQGLMDADIMMQTGLYDIYKYSCKERWINTPGGRGAHYTSVDGRPMPWYNHGAYGFLQIEGDVWVSGAWTQTGVSKITENNWHLRHLLNNQVDVLQILYELGHVNILEEYTNISGGKHSTYKDMVLDMGYLPFQIITAVYDSKDNAVYDNGAKMFPEYWNGLSENEKQTLVAICDLKSWNGGNDNTFDATSNSYNATLQKFVVDLTKYLCTYGNAEIVGTGRPDAVLSGSNWTTVENESALKWIAAKVYGSNSQEYKTLVAEMTKSVFYTRTMFSSFVYCVKAISCAQTDLDTALGKINQAKADIYNLSLDGSGAINGVKIMSCGCHVPCSKCDCHGEYTANLGEALPIFTGNDTSGLYYTNNTLSMTNNAKKIIDAGVSSYYMSVFGTKTRPNVAGIIKNKVNLTVVEIKCWDWEGADSDVILTNNFNKVTCTRQIVVASELAGVVEQMFADIYRHPTKPVIGWELYGFRGVANASNSSNMSEHSFGIAIDVNHCGYRDVLAGVKYNSAYYNCIDPECRYTTGLSLPYSGTSKFCALHGLDGTCNKCGMHLGMQYESSAFKSNGLWAFVAVKSGDEVHAYSNGYVYGADIRLVTTDEWYEDYKLIADTSYYAKKLMQKMMTSDGVITKIMNAYGFYWNINKGEPVGDQASDAMHFGFVGSTGRGASEANLSKGGAARDPRCPEFWDAANWPDTTEGVWDYSGIGPSSGIRGRADYFTGISDVFDMNGDNIRNSIVVTP